MQLRFIGENGSMGLIHGRVYNRIRIVSRIDMIWVHWVGGCCPYSSLRALLQNWEEL